VKRLGSIVSNFLRFGALNEKGWKEEVVVPLRIGSGLEPEVGAVMRLDGLMKAFMVRHR